MTNIVYGELEPGAASRGTAVWLRLEKGTSIPMGMYWYVKEAKAWLPIPPASRCLGDIELFVGNPHGVFDLDAVRSPTSWGKGLIDGPKVGWAVMNGLNGTVEATDHFFVSAALNQANDAFDRTANTWRSRVEANVLKNKGGEASVILSSNNVPKFEHTISDPGHIHTVLQPPPEREPRDPRDRRETLYENRNALDSYSATLQPEGYRGPVPSVYTLTTSTTGITISSKPSGTSIVSHNNVPPFLSVCPIQWIGYGSYKT